MVMHTLNCTYGGGINHDAKSRCCFVGRIAGGVRRCRQSSQVAVMLSCRDCCQDSLSLKVESVGVASFPSCGWRRCNVYSDTCGKHFGLQTESLCVCSLQFASPSRLWGWDCRRDFSPCQQSKALLQSWATHQEAVTDGDVWKVSYVFQVLKAWFWSS